MPYAAVERPSLALGTLTAALEREGFSCRSVHANLDFAASVGRLIYETVNNSDITLQIGEWSFSPAVFGQHGDVDGFLEGLIRYGFSETGLRDLMLDLRAQAAAFVETLARQILELKPAIVGCSSVFQQHCASLALLRRIRELDPAVVTMLGGANCEAEMGASTHRLYPWVDFVVSGEADALLPDLCRRIFAHGREMAVPLLPSGVFGPALRRHTAAPPTGAERRLTADLDSLPMPNFDDYFEQLAASPLRDHVITGLPIETSRGCWWGSKHHCSFCGLNGTGIVFRSKSQRRAQDEIRYLADRYRIKKFMATDNIIDNKYFSSVLPFLADSGDMLWFYETKANLNRAQVEMLSQAGVRWIQPGIEALDDRLLNLLNKGCSTVINVQLLKWAYNYGIWVMWNHLYGVPGENPDWYEQIADWVPLIVHLQPPSGGGMTRVRFDRFSPYFDNQARFGLNLKPCWGYGQAYPMPPEELGQLAYFFRDENQAKPSPRLAVLLKGWAAGYYARTTTPITLPRRAEDAPVLALVAEASRLTVRDTRPCAVAPRHELSELEAQLCLSLDSALGAEALVAALRRAGCTASGEEISRARQRLVDLKIVADFGGRFLCLATDENPIPYRSFADFAGGMFCVSTPQPPPESQTPWDISLNELFASYPVVAPAAAAL
ncbi:MAG: RiPP maturation radical SAM C-methyltransferase [Rhodospirillaceae bacterium]